MQLFSKRKPVAKSCAALSSKKKRRSEDIDAGSESSSSSSDSDDDDDDDDDDDESPPSMAPSTTSTPSSSKTTPYATRFESLNLPPPLLALLSSLKITTPSPIQSRLLGSPSHSHVLATSPTGSGKTLAFLLPILRDMSADPYGPYAVILTPTRELGVQIHQQCSLLGSPYATRQALVTGGEDMVEQSVSLSSSPHFVVGTPGRLVSILENESVRVRGVRYVVLDEVDRLLSSDPLNQLAPDVLEVWSLCRAGRRCRMLAFSATGGDEVRGLLREMVGGERIVEYHEGNDPTPQPPPPGAKAAAATAALAPPGNAAVGAEGKGRKQLAKLPAGLKQSYIFMPHALRTAYLLAALRNLLLSGGVSPSGSGGQAAEGSDSGKARSCVIFTGTCLRCAHLHLVLREVGVASVPLHSLLPQHHRSASLHQFKSRAASVLVATDVASRGLDVPSVDLVINESLPSSASAYIHRAGRTARAGRRGQCLTLVGPEDVGRVHAVEAMTGEALDKEARVLDKDVEPLLSSVAKAERLAKVRLGETGMEERERERDVRRGKERARRLKAAGGAKKKKKRGGDK